MGQLLERQLNNFLFLLLNDLLDHLVHVQLPAVRLPALISFFGPEERSFSPD
jgi:hypothetical protein